MDPRTLNLKRCPHCGRHLGLAHFSRQSGAPDGLQSWCKECAHKHGQPPRKGTPARERYDQGLPPEGAMETPPPPPRLKPKQIHNYHMGPLDHPDIERLARTIERVGADEVLSRAQISMTTLRNLQNGQPVSRYVRQKTLKVVRQVLAPPPLEAPAPEPAEPPWTTLPPEGPFPPLPLPEPVIIPPPPPLAEEVSRAARALENNGPLLEFLVDLETYVKDQVARGVPLGALQLRYMAVWPPSGFRTLAVP